MVSPFASDFEFYRSVAFRTPSFVGGALFVDVNTYVRIATVEFHADKLSLLLFFRRW